MTIVLAALGVPSGAARRCSRMPQNQREWLRLYPYPQASASWERLAVSTERPHSTGVESNSTTWSW